MIELMIHLVKEQVVNYVVMSQVQFPGAVEGRFEMPRCAGA